MIDTSSKVVNSTLATNSRVYRDCLIENSQMAECSTIGDNSVVRDSTISVRGEIGRRNSVRSAIIGRATYTGSDCNISHCRIGAYCAISWSVSIGGADHNFAKLALTPKYRITHNKEDVKNPYPESWGEMCVVGNDVWLASGVCVLRGVTIGDGCVVGANAVVTKDLPPYSIAAGSPARVIRRRFSEETIDFLEHAQWWNLPEELLRRESDIFDLKDEGQIVSALKTIIEKYGGSSEAK